MSRAKYCRGFGIQSPWAYRFVRYVVNEHYPYYAYDDLRPLFPHLSKRERRVCELYLRIANHQQADEAVLVGDVSEAKRAYLHAGCLRMVFSSMGEGACLLTEDSFSLAVVAHGQDMEQQVLSLINRATDASLLIVEGILPFVEPELCAMFDYKIFVDTDADERIHRNGETRRSWARILQDKRVRVSFDLYYCGLLFFDKKKYKQHYKINF